MTNSIGWPLRTGQDFIPNHAVSTIDFASIHFWPDNWGRTDLDFGKTWMTSHVNMSSIVLKKPLIVEEFGKAFGGTQLFLAFAKAKKCVPLLIRTLKFALPACLPCRALLKCCAAIPTQPLLGIPPCVLVKVARLLSFCLFAGPASDSGLGQTAAQQLDYYKLVYSIVETSIDSADVVKGIAFWRWSAASSPTDGLAAFDNYATISELCLPSLNTLDHQDNQYPCQHSHSTQVPGLGMRGIPGCGH